jgi:hypothetical protein
VKGGIKFVKSSFSARGEYCVGVHIGKDLVTLTNTREDDDRMVSFTPKEWRVFIKGVKSGEFEI